MKSIIVLTPILLFYGCGIQGSGGSNSAPASNATPSPASAPRFTESYLPTNISIDFPLALIAFLKEPLLKKDIEKISQQTEVIKEQILLLEEVMPQVEEECQNEELCTFSAHYFNNSLGAFSLYSSNDIGNNNKRIELKVDEANSLKVQWSSDNNDDVTTSYYQKDASLTLHYRNSDLENETVVITSKSIPKRSDYLIQSNYNAYSLKSNYIALNNDKFSNSIEVVDENVTDFNENLIEVTTLSKDYNEGSYLILSQTDKEKDLSFEQKVEKSRGLLTIFNQEVQGFVIKAQPSVTASQSDDINELELTPLF